MLIFFCVAASFGAVTFKVNAPTIVGAGEKFRIEFVVNDGQGSGFAEPRFQGVDLQAGPSIASGSSTIMSGGRMTTTARQMYTYVLQVLDGVSVIRVSGAAVTVSGRRYTTAPFTIEVRARSSSMSPARASRGRSLYSNGGRSAKDDVLLRMEVDRRELYKGEALVASLKVYTQMDLQGFENIKYPSFNGFWAQELDVSDLEPVRVDIGGKVYACKTMREWLLYPQRAGWLTIEQSDFTAVVQEITMAAPTGNSLFDDLIGSMPDVRIVRHPMVTLPTKIFVKELPMPQPDGFSGAVGQFTMKTSFANSAGGGNSGRFAAGSAQSVDMTVTGNGNFPLLEAPTITFPESFEVYDTKSHEQVTYSALGATGTLTWEYPFIARTMGDFAVSGGRFVYFDPKTSAYKTLTSPTLQMHVTADVSANGVKDSQILGSDIKFLKLGTLNLKARGDQLLGSGLFFAILALIIILFVIILVLFHRRAVLSGDRELSRQLKARKVALARLKRARVILNAVGASSSVSSGESKDMFYKELLQAVWGYLGDKYGIAASTLTKEYVRSFLTDQGVDVALVEELTELIDMCEMAQYSNLTLDVQQGSYDAALKIIGQLEKH